MTRVDDMVVELRQKYRTNPTTTLGDFLATRAVFSTDTLADLIAADAEIRVSLGQDLDLQMYLDTVDGLAERPEALDTAIEMVLRRLTASGKTLRESAETLIHNYPHLADPIRTAAALGELLGSTPSPADASVAKARSLPCEFGPTCPDGRSRYELRELLGSGTQGTVYLAVDRQLSEPDHPAWTAIKFSGRAQPDEHERQRLADEAARARRIMHPNVVRVFDRGIGPEGEDYLVFEHVRGRSLDTVLRDAGGVMPPRQAAEIIANLASGVHAVHAAGLVHCDLKPANVLVAESGEPKVADFGLAISHRAASPVGSQTSSPSRLGTLGFMAPEQYRIEEGSLAPAADMYALGGLLVYLITQQPANGTMPEEAIATLTAPAIEHAARIGRRLMRITDPDLRAIARRALAASPSNRYASADALAGDLRAWLAREVIPWTRPTIARRCTLAWRRAPLTVATVGALIVGVGVTVMIAVGARSAVREARWAAEAREARVREEASRTKMAEMQKMTQASINLLKGYGAKKIGDGTILLLTVLETALGPAFFADHDANFELWNQRIEIARQRQSTAAGGAEGFESLQWGLLEGFWLAQSQRYAEAAAVLQGNLEGWRRHVRDGDPWLDDIAALHAACRLLAARGSTRTDGVGDQPSGPTLLSGVDQDAPTPAGGAANHGDPQRQPMALSEAESLGLRSVVARCLARHAQAANQPSRLLDLVRKAEEADEAK
jgi:Protein kinase domain